MINTLAIILVAGSVMTLGLLVARLIALNELVYQGIKAILEELDTPSTANGDLIFFKKRGGYRLSESGKIERIKASSTQGGKFKYKVVKSKSSLK